MADISTANVAIMQALRDSLADFCTSRGITVDQTDDLTDLILYKVRSLKDDSLIINLFAGQEYELNDTEGLITAINNTANQVSKGCTKVNLPAVTYIAAGAFGSCPVTDANLGSKDVGIWIGNSAFSNCTLLKSVNVFGNVTTDTGSFNGPFINCTSLEKVFFNKLVAHTGNYGEFKNCTSLLKFKSNSVVTLNTSQFFSGCTSLKLIDFGDIAAFTGSGLEFLYNCSSIKAIVIQRPDGNPITTLQNSAIFNYLINNHLDWGLYVPYSRVADFKAGTQWSNIATYIKSIQENLATLVPIDFDYEEYIEIVDTKGDIPAVPDATKVYWVKTATPDTYEQYFYGSGAEEQLVDITI